MAPAIRASPPYMPREPEYLPIKEDSERADYTSGSFAAAIAAPLTIFVCIIVLLFAFHMISRQPAPRRASKGSREGKEHRAWSDPESIQIGRMSSMTASVGNCSDTTVQANRVPTSAEDEAAYSFGHIAPSQATTVSTVPSASNSLIRLPGPCAHLAWRDLSGVGLHQM